MESASIGLYSFILTCDSGVTLSIRCLIVILYLNSIEFYWLRYLASRLLGARKQMLPSFLTQFKIEGYFLSTKIFKRLKRSLGMKQI